MPAQVLDVEQYMLLLELEAPFDKRDVQLARRRLAKRWHPDIAPAGRQFEHERHLKAVNLAADQLERIAEGSRSGRVSRNAVRASAAAARREREAAGRRAYEAQERARAHASDREKHDPFASRLPDHSVVHRYARCLSYPEWGVGTVTGIYFTDDPAGGSEVQQWARVRFSHGVRTVPAGSMRFVDFSKPDPAEERMERFMLAAQRAMAEGEYELAAQRLVYARDAEPTNVAVLRLMTLAFWQAGNLDAAARAVRDWARADGSHPAAHRFAARIYEDIGAFDLAEEAAQRAALAGPQDAGAWERVARLRVRLGDREGALDALRSAGANGSGDALSALLAQALAMEPQPSASNGTRKHAARAPEADPRV
jgi:tetratricopeptide (TPR) repeat protein